MTRFLLLAPLVIATASAASLTERQSSCACGYKDSTGAVWVCSRSVPVYQRTNSDLFCIARVVCIRLHDWLERSLEPELLRVRLSGEPPQSALHYAI
jgi:hypothetical protein